MIPIDEEPTFDRTSAHFIGQTFLSLEPIPTPAVDIIEIRIHLY
jgi:hypothetical protein